MTSKKSLIIIIGLLATYVLSPFAVPIIAGVCMSIAGMPYQITLERRGFSPRVAAWIHTLFWTVLLALPIWMIIETAVPAMINLLKNPPTPGSMLAMISGIPMVGSWLADHAASALSAPLTSEKLAGWASNNASALKMYAHQVWILLAHIGIALLVADAVSRHHLTLGEAIERIVLWSSGDEKFTHSLLAIAAQAIRSVVLGVLGGALFDGVLVGVIMAFAQVPSWPIWTVAVAILSSVPMGSTVVIIIASAVLLTEQHWIAALSVLVLSHMITLSADFFIKPRLTGAKTHTPFMIALLSILGGVEVFGLIGLIVGPVIVLTAAGLWQQWERQQT
ncbi:MAG: AI-2E family transporter [Burkholderiales bacterium]